MSVSQSNTMTSASSRSPRRSLTGQLNQAMGEVDGVHNDVEILAALEEKYEWEIGKHGLDVIKGKCKATNEAVIRKYIGFKGSGQGAPYHVIREATILKDLHHPNIIRLFDVVHKLYSVEFIYECLPRDLRTVLDEKCSPDYEAGPATCRQQLMHYFKQMLDGVAFLHTRCILHRDLKPNDLRISDRNVIKITNFRLARQFTLPLRTYTHEVVTLWYRPPEIFLGKKRYDTSVDMWSAGCLLAEITSGEALFRGDSEIDQLFQIFHVLGTPTKAVWPELKTLPDYKATFPKWPPGNVKEVVPGISDVAEDLLMNLLVYDCSKRLTARDALKHPFFDELKTWVPPSTRPPESKYLGVAPSPKESTPVESP